MKLHIPLLTCMALIGFAAPTMAADVIEKKDSQDPKSSIHTQMQVTVKDSTRGLAFELHPDGKVELTVKEEDKDSGKTSEKTYKADSLEDFNSKYADVAKKYQIERFVPRTFWSNQDQASGSAWNNWKKWFADDWFWDRGHDSNKWFKEWWRPMQSDDLDNWVDDQNRLFEKFRSITPPLDPLAKMNSDSPTSSPAFGLRISAVDESLVTQLGMKEGEGILVVSVLDNTPAQRAGLKKHDIILKVEGKSITDRGEFRRKVRELAGKGFELEIIRQGKHETINVLAEKV